MNKTSLISLKVFDNLMMWFSRCIKCHVNTFLQLHLVICDIRSHVTSSLQVKVACCVCTKEEMEYFYLYSNITTGLNSKNKPEQN